MSKSATILLRSFLRKSINAFALKELIRHSGATLNRLGRSRNWQLTATRSQLNKIIEAILASKQDSWQWLAQYLQKQQQQYTYQELVQFARSNPSITANELVIKTDCSLSQARQVLDELEWQ